MIEYLPCLPLLCRSVCRCCVEVSVAGCALYILHFRLLFTTLTPTRTLHRTLTLTPTITFRRILTPTIIRTLPLPHAHPSEQIPGHGAQPEEKLGNSGMLGKIQGSGSRDTVRKKKKTRELWELWELWNCRKTAIFEISGFLMHFLI